MANVRVFAMIALVVAVNSGESIAMPPQDIPTEVKAWKEIWKASMNGRAAFAPDAVAFKPKALFFTSSQYAVGKQPCNQNSKNRARRVHTRVNRERPHDS